MVSAARRYPAYAALVIGDLAALPFCDGAFAGFVCSGAFGPGHAPPRALHELARVTRPGGVGVFTLREDTFKAQGFPPVLAALAASGDWEELHETCAFQAYLAGEPHLWARAFAVRILR